MSGTSYAVPGTDGAYAGTRHLAEFWMIEPEIAFANLEYAPLCCPADAILRQFSVPPRPRRHFSVHPFAHT
eukprot:475399-Rhodomonas_salina.1